MKPLKFHIGYIHYQNPQRTADGCTTLCGSVGLPSSRLWNAPTLDPDRATWALRNTTELDTVCRSCLWSYLKALDALTEQPGLRVRVHRRNIRAFLTHQPHIIPGTDVTTAPKPIPTHWLEL